VTATFADNAGVRIAYESFGDGPALLLIQGIGYARWSWDPIVPTLAERFRILSFDNRGIGESDVPPPPYSARELADDGLAVLDDAGVDRAHVLGASLGGMAAQELAAAFPERVDKLVLACTTPGGASAVPMPAQTVALMQEAAALAPEVAMRRFVENALAPDAGVALVDDLYQRRIANPPDPIGWQGQAAAGLGFDGSALEVAAPTLILHGTEDAVVDPGNAALLAERIPGARVELFSGCGHLFFWEQPERSARTVAEFLA
jgi:pimeloyl-ACP methyl ester carboxylesterase